MRRAPLFLGRALLPLLAAAPAGASTGGGIVRPCFDTACPHWNDTDGNRIEAHAAGMLQAPNGRWYWYGESKKTSSLADHGVNCYSAPDISGPWKNEGQVFHQGDIHMSGQSGPFIVERPKVLYNTDTKTYVMWFHLDTSGYKFRHAGVATSKTPEGPFTFSHGIQPDGIPSLDMSLFRDPVDGQAYFIRSCNNQYAGFSRLTKDYLNSTGIISQHSVYEGMALFRHPNGTYYIITSHLTGWNPNPLMLYRAAGKTLDDPQWVDMGNPTGDQTSFNTQPTYVVQFTPNKGDPYFVYMADNWVHGGPAGLIDASYVWLPFDFGANTVTLHKQASWSLDDPFAVPPTPAPPPCPSAGARLRLGACGGAGKWAVDGGHVTLQGSTLCSTYTGGGGNSDPLVLGACSSAASFSWADGKMKDAQTGRCWDVRWCGGSVCDGEELEMYDCNNDHPNQQFTLSSSGELASKIDGKCVTAC